MKRRTKIISIVILPLVAIMILYPILSVFLGADLGRAITLKSRIDKLIDHTDQQALLTACRNLIREDYRGQYDFGYYGWGRLNRHPDIDKFPKEIKDLKPFTVRVSDNKVVIELLGGLSRCFLIAYSEDYEKKQYGKKKLIDGLWISSDIMDFEWIEKNGISPKAPVQDYSGTPYLIQHRNR